MHFTKFFSAAKNENKFLKLRFAAEANTNSLSVGANSRKRNMSVQYIIIIIIISNLHNVPIRLQYKCLANAKRPCNCCVLCIRLKSSLCSCAHSISDMTKVVTVCAQSSECQREEI